MKNKKEEEKDRACGHQNEINGGDGGELLQDADDSQASSGKGQHDPGPQQPVQWSSQEGGEKDTKGEEPHADGANAGLDAQVVDDARQEQAEHLHAEENGQSWQAQGFYQLYLP